MPHWWATFARHACAQAIHRLEKTWSVIAADTYILCIHNFINFLHIFLYCYVSLWQSAFFSRWAGIMYIIHVYTYVIFYYLWEDHEKTIYLSSKLQQSIQMWRDVRRRDIHGRRNVGSMATAGRSNGSSMIDVHAWQAQRQQHGSMAGAQLIATIGR